MKRFPFSHQGDQIFPEEHTKKKKQTGEEKIIISIVPEISWSLKDKIRVDQLKIHMNKP